MAGTSAGLEMTRNKLVELNNNSQSSVDLSEIDKLEKVTEVSVFSRLSDCGADDKFTKTIPRQHSWQNLLGRKSSENCISPFQRGRSNSDGAAITLTDNADVFPSLPVSVLEKMGLYGEGPRERLSEETLEQKFTSLSLAFTIDAATIKDRCDRQRRTRDQTETNFNLEVEKLREKLALLQPLCTDFDRAELLSTLFAQVDTLTKAASLVSIAGERFGAVQHEERLTESVQLMVSHVQALKQQRDSARRQLQYTKRVLQEPIQDGPYNGTTNQKNLGGSIHKKVINKRRASIDPSNLPQQQEQNLNFSRRISELSFRASLTKNNRPRLELGMELNKIKEISHDDNNKDSAVVDSPVSPALEVVKEDGFNFEPTTETCTKTDEIFSYRDAIRKVFDLVRKYLLSNLETIREKLGKAINKWPENGYLYAILNSWAVLCFSISILTLVSIFLEHEYVEKFPYSILPWSNRKH